MDVYVYDRALSFIVPAAPSERGNPSFPSLKSEQCRMHAQLPLTSDHQVKIAPNHEPCYILVELTNTMTLQVKTRDRAAIYLLVAASSLALAGGSSAPSS